MNIIYLNERYLKMLLVYQNVNLENPFSVDALTELFNVKDLSIIRKETELFISSMPIKFSNEFKMHTVFDKLVIEYDIQLVSKPLSPSYGFTPLNDKGLIVYPDSCDFEDSLINAIDKVYSPAEIMGTPLWACLTK